MIFLSNSAWAADEGENLYQKNCGICHNPGGAGFLQLIHRYGPEQAVLTNRKQLPAQFIQIVVRNGQGNMPPLTKNNVSDSELLAIAQYLGQLKQ
jgi:mono/diheme cytochrome c family protein